MVVSRQLDIFSDHFIAASTFARGALGSVQAGEYKSLEINELSFPTLE